MCHESTSVALAETIGIGKGSRSACDDIHDAELIVICGQNPGTNHPRMLTALEKAKQNGAKILAINPLPEAGLHAVQEPADARAGLSGVGTGLADLHLPIRINGDLALFQAIGALLLERGGCGSRATGTVLDLDFIERHTTGFDDWAEALSDARLGRRRSTPPGSTRAQIEEAADMFAGLRRARCTAGRWASPSTATPSRRSRSSSTSPCSRATSASPAPGCARSAGTPTSRATARWASGRRCPTTSSTRLRDEFGFEPPREHGLDTVDSIRALRDGKAKVFMGMGGNFVSAAPDTVVTEEAMRSGRADRAGLDQAQPLPRRSAARRR